VAREQVEQDLLRLPHDLHHPGMPVHPFVQECLDRDLGLRHLSWKRDQRLGLVANFLDADRPGALQTKPRLGKYSADETGNQLTYQLRATPVVVEAAMVHFNI